MVSGPKVPVNSSVGRAAAVRSASVVSILRWVWSQCSLLVRRCRRGGGCDG